MMIPENNTPQKPKAWGILENQYFGMRVNLRAHVIELSSGCSGVFWRPSGPDQEAMENRSLTKSAATRSVPASSHLASELWHSNYGQETSRRSPNKTAGSVRVTCYIRVRVFGSFGSLTQSRILNHRGCTQITLLSVQ